VDVFMARALCIAYVVHFTPVGTGNGNSILLPDAILAAKDSNSKHPIFERSIQF
jgi:hypothetical protein